jgi:hypothetical protein
VDASDPAAVEATFNAFYAANAVYEMTATMDRWGAFRGAARSGRPRACIIGPAYLLESTYPATR